RTNEAAGQRGGGPGPVRSSLPDPGHRGLRRLARRLVLAIAPVTAWALFVMRSPAGGADHGVIPRCTIRASPVALPWARRISARTTGHRTGLGGVGTPDAAAPFRGPLFLGQGTRGAVLLRAGKGVVGAFRLHRARGADDLRLAFARLALWLPFSIGAEKEHDILASARGGVLPSPTRPWRHGHLPTYLRHEAVASFSFPVFPRPSKHPTATRTVP